MVQTAGAYDPAGGIGVGFRFYSTSPFSGVHDPHLDTLLNEAQGTTNMATRCSYYNQAAEYIAKNYYGPFYFTFSPANVSVHGIAGPGLTTRWPLSPSCRRSRGRTCTTTRPPDALDHP